LAVRVHARTARSIEKRAREGAALSDPCRLTGWSIRGHGHYVNDCSGQSFLYTQAARVGIRSKIMPKVSPFHSKEPTSVHHNNSVCTEGDNIESYNKVSGTGGKPLCVTAHASVLKASRRSVPSTVRSAPRRLGARTGAVHGLVGRMCEPRPVLGTPPGAGRGT
jgi:hypothetical protein